MKIDSALSQLARDKFRLFAPARYKISLRLQSRAKLFFAKLLEF